jgi:hypothetical protein
LTDTLKLEDTFNKKHVETTDIKSIVSEVSINIFMAHVVHIPHLFDITPPSAPCAMEGVIERQKIFSKRSHCTNKTFLTIKK